MKNEFCLFGDRAIEFECVQFFQTGQIDRSKLPFTLWLRIGIGPRELQWNLQVGPDICLPCLGIGWCNSDRRDLVSDAHRKSHESSCKSLVVPIVDIPAIVDAANLTRHPAAVAEDADITRPRRRIRSRMQHEKARRAAGGNRSSQCHRFWQTLRAQVDVAIE